MPIVLIDFLFCGKCFKHSPLPFLSPGKVGGGGAGLLTWAQPTRFGKGAQKGGKEVFLIYRTCAPGELSNMPKVAHI